MRHLGVVALGKEGCCKGREGDGSPVVEAAVVAGPTLVVAKEGELQGELECPKGMMVEWTPG